MRGLRKLPISTLPKSVMCVMVLAAPLLPATDIAELVYQDRGDRWEGTDGDPSTGGPYLALSSALALSARGVPKLPERVYCRFYLPDGPAVWLRFRELNHIYGYRLDKIRSSWTLGANEYSWPTSTVLKQLGQQGLSVDSLGFVARLNADQPSRDELVAPILVTATPVSLTAITGYRIVLRRSDSIKDLKFDLYRIPSRSSSLAVGKPLSIAISLINSSESMEGSANMTFDWKADDMPGTGWYRFRVSGKMPKTDTETVIGVQHATTLFHLR